MLPTPVDKVFQRSFRGMERGGLLVVAAAILWAGGAEVLRLIETQKVGVSDLLLLFIYLEMISMVEMYWRRGKLPVRLPLYIAMVGIARHMMADSTYHAPWLMLAGGGSILLLAVAVLIVRYGHMKFPYPADEQSGAANTEQRADG